jgi:hypothetical protein
MPGNEEMRNLVKEVSGTAAVQAYELRDDVFL